MEIKSQKNKVIKILVIGNSASGKTAIQKRHFDNSFSNQHQQTIGIEFYQKTYNQLPCGVKVKCQYFQLAGGQSFQKIGQTYYKNADGFIFVYDVTHKSSFESTRYWIKKSIKHQQQGKSYGLLLANKIDLQNQRVVTQQQGKQLGLKRVGLFQQVSAKTGKNINQAFEKLINKILSGQKETIKFLNLPYLKEKEESAPT